MSEDTPGQPPSDETGSTEPLGPQSTPTGRIGRYRILQKIGEGGMGEVYLAEQDDPRRKVALKIIKWGMDTKQVIARFEAERQALALMDHPNIAKVFDAGATEHGRPYFVMEYVKGVPITEHCDTHRLTTKERLEIFIQACEGVQHAHQKAVIHRDIKPSNVLVAIQDGNAVPKIIDFGVAKATAQRLTEKTMFTATGVMVGTPEYMSPEQADLTSQDIDTRTDVYSLGVTLYELLTGALPFDAQELRRAGFDEIRRRIREDEPSKPSTRISPLGDALSDLAQKRRTDPRSLSKQLTGDLDWITMQALEKDRSRRYQSSSDLAADIQRHLQYRAVLARAPSIYYRARKFTQRHRVGVIGALILATVFIGSLLLSFEVKRARERSATTQSELMRQTEETVIATLQGSPPIVENLNATARNALRRLVERVYEKTASREDSRRLASALVELRPAARRLLRPSESVSVVSVSSKRVDGLDETVGLLMWPQLRVDGGEVAENKQVALQLGTAGASTSWRATMPDRPGLFSVSGRIDACLVASLGSQTLVGADDGLADQFPCLSSQFQLAVPEMSFVVVDDIPDEYPTRITDSALVQSFADGVRVQACSLSRLSEDEYLARIVLDIEPPVLFTVLRVFLLRADGANRELDLGVLTLGPRSVGLIGRAGATTNVRSNDAVFNVSFEATIPAAMLDDMMGDPRFDLRMESSRNLVLEHTEHDVYLSVSISKTVQAGFD